MSAGVPSREIKRETKRGFGTKKMSLILQLMESLIERFCDKSCRMAYISLFWDTVVRAQGVDCYEIKNKLEMTTTKSFMIFPVRAV